MEKTSRNSDDLAADPNFESQESAVPPLQRPDLRSKCCSLVSALGRRDLGLFYARLDSDLTFIQTNLVLDRILDAVDATGGTDSSGLLGRSLRDLVESAGDFRTIEHALHDQESFATPGLRMRSLTSRGLSCSMSLCADRRRHIVAGVVEDVSRVAEEKRQRDLFFRNAFDIVCLVNTDGSIRNVNPSFERVLGYEGGELIDRPILDFLHPEDLSATMSTLLRMSRGAPTVSFVNRFRCKDGSWKELEWTATPDRDSAAIYATARDVTERRKMDLVERALLANQVERGVARDIQQRLLPVDPPRLPGFDIAGVSHPIEEVGGDYYDFIPLDSDRLAIAIGDASGHGLGPALMMAEMRTCLWSMLPYCANLEELLRRANRLLYDSTPDGCFLTLVLAELETRTGMLRYASCGHPASYVLNAAGEVKRRLESTALPLAAFEDCRLQAGPEIRLEPGDLLVCITDGVLESFDPSGEPFGEDRLLDVVRANYRKSARDIAGSIHRAVQEQARDSALADDITSVIVKAFCLPA
jgi:PAS domain S-box-containing protein